MKYAIVYSSRTGNTKLLAETAKSLLPAENCVYFGVPDPAALKAHRIYAGFWTDKGSCDQQTAEFLKSLNTQEVFLFGTAGFGEIPEYFSKILERSAENLPESVKLCGSFMCQGRMPMSVRERYVKMKEGPAAPSNIDSMIKNFDSALIHPDENDLENFRKVIQETI